MKKRREIFAAGANWIEIDLLRDGVRTVNPPFIADTEYLVYLSRSGPPRQGYAWPIRLPERLPIIGIPLRGSDPDVPLDLQAVLATVIERGSYDLDFDYSKDPVPPLTGEAADWARQITKERPS